MFTNEIINKEDIMASIESTIDVLMDKDVDNLSNNELALLKNVSLSSIMAMKKKKYTNEQILKTRQHGPKDNTIVIKTSIAQMSDEELFEKFGLKRI